MNKKTVLQQWDDRLSDEQAQKLDAFYNRRAFLANSLKLLIGIPLLSVAGCGDSTEVEAREPWETIDAVQQHLFPADGNGPSSGDINALPYLVFVLNTPDIEKELPVFIEEGAGWLNQYCQSTFSLPFLQLDNDRKEQALQSIAQSQSGNRWLSHLLLYIFEALASDPIYGGNPGGIGWQWLEHKPGFPRPGPDQSYTVLVKR